MAEIPPPENPESTPPPVNYVAYPRGDQPFSYGDPDRLQALADGYFGLNNIFILNIALALGARGLSTTAKSPEQALGLYAGLIVAMFALIAFLTYPHNKKIGFGKNWPSGNAVLASILMGINSALCCGIIGYVVMQIIAANERKRYGLKGSAFGFKKKDVKAYVDQMRLQRSQPRPTPSE